MFCLRKPEGKTCALLRNSGCGGIAHVLRAPNTGLADRASHPNPSNQDALVQLALPLVPAPLPLLSPARKPV